MSNTYGKHQLFIQRDYTLSTPSTSCDSSSSFVSVLQFHRERSLSTSSDGKFELAARVKDEKKEIKHRIINELKKETTFEKIRNKYRQAYSKPFTYDPVMYGQYEDSCYKVRNRLIEIFDSDVIYLQDPDFSESSLSLYQNWMKKHEESRESKRLLRAHEMDKKIELSMVQDKIRAKINAQLSKFKTLSTISTIDQKGPDKNRTVDNLYMSKKTEIRAKPKAQTQEQKYKIGNLTLKTPKVLQNAVRVQNSTMDELYTTADELIDQIELFIPRKILSLRKKYDEEVVPEEIKSIGEECKSKGYAAKIKESFFKTFSSREEENKYKIEAKKTLENVTEASSTAVISTDMTEDDTTRDFSFD